MSVSFDPTYNPNILLRKQLVGGKPMETEHMPPLSYKPGTLTLRVAYEPLLIADKVCSVVRKDIGTTQIKENSEDVVSARRVYDFYVVSRDELSTDNPRPKLVLTDVKPKQLDTAMRKIYDSIMLLSK